MRAGCRASISRRARPPTRRRWSMRAWGQLGVQRLLAGAEQTGHPVPHAASGRQPALQLRHAQPRGDERHPRAESTHLRVPDGPSPGGREGLLTLAARGRWADPACCPASGSRARWRTSPTRTSRCPPGPATRRSATWRASCPGRRACRIATPRSPATIPRPRATSASTRSIPAASTSGCRASPWASC